MSDELKHLARKVAKGKSSRREFLGRASALGISATFGNALLAVAARAEGPVKGGHFSLGLYGGESTNSLDPALTLTQVPAFVLRHYGDLLCRTLPDGSLQFDLAESAESNEDATEWRFKIRKGVEFHNGKTMTPDDVLKTLQRHSDENSESGALGIMQGISELSVDGDYVVMKMETGNADLPYLMTDYHLVIQPDGGMEDPNSGVGTGPYKIVDNEPGVRHTFEKFANHWNPDAGHVDTTELLVINDSAARTSALQSGQVQMINRVEPKVASLMENAPGVVVQAVAGPGHYVFVMHCDTAPFDNNDLRLALKYAVKRQEMVDTILSGYGSVGNDIPINAAYPLFDESNLPQREFDMEMAKKHYEASGHDGSPIVLRVADGAFPGAVDAAQLFQSSAEECGIPLEVQREPDDGYWSEVWNKQPFCASYWSGRPVQDQMYSTAYYSKADWNDTRFFDEEFDKILIMARGETEEATRKGQYNELATILNQTGGLICPMFNNYVDAVSENVQGYVPNPANELMGMYAPINCWLPA